MGVEVHTLISVLGRWRQEDLREFKARIQKVLVQQELHSETLSTQTKMGGQNKDYRIQEPS